MPTWIWNKILRRWWHSSTNGENDNIYRWSNRAQTSRQVARYWIGIRKFQSWVLWKAPGMFERPRSVFCWGRFGWMRKSWRFRDSPRWRQLRAMFVLQPKCSSTVCWNAPWWTWFVRAKKTFFQSWGRHKFTYHSEFAMTKQSGNYRL
jgi:hypothetical protein